MKLGLCLIASLLSLTTTYQILLLKRQRTYTTMIKKCLSLFLLCTSYAFADLSYSDDWEYNLLDGVDLEDATTYYDFNKSMNSNDSYLCWAFSAANVLQYWQDKQNDYYITINGIPDGDDDGEYSSAILTEFIDAWGNEYGFEFDAFTWWLADTEGHVQYDGETDYPSGGGYWSEYFTDDSSFYTISVLDDSAEGAFIAVMDDAITNDYGMILCIFADTTGDGNLNGAHAVTLWGYSIDEDGNYYLYLTDSDDGLDQMVQVAISYDEEDECWYFDDFYSSDAWFIGRVTTLDVGVLSITIPEPSTASLSLLALAALLKRRKRARV